MERASKCQAWAEPSDFGLELFKPKTSKNQAFQALRNSKNQAFQAWPKKDFFSVFYSN
jgi:hypothetical protein